MEDVEDKEDREDIEDNEDKADTADMELAEDKKEVIYIMLLYRVIL